MNAKRSLEGGKMPELSKEEREKWIKEHPLPIWKEQTMMSNWEDENDNND